MPTNMNVVSKETIKPQTAVAFELQRGQLLKVTDPEGQQVSELICYKISDPDEWLSNGRTLDHTRVWAIGKGCTLYSNRSHAMLSILEDTCGKHDFFLAPCSQNKFQEQNNESAPHTFCHENLYRSLMGWDIDPDEIYATFSIFMNVKLKHDGTIAIEPPISKAGDYIIFRAEMDLVVGLTACASVDYNNGSLKAIEYEILEE